MEPWGRLVVLAVAITAVVSSPLANKLQPGKEWPTRNSVQQPQDVWLQLQTSTTDASDLSTTELPPEEQTDAAIEAIEVTTEENNVILRTSDSENDPLEAVVPTEESNDILVKSLEESEKVDYSGAQVWKVPTSSSKVRSLLGNLRSRNMISPWGGNHSYIDLLVKPEAINNVSQELRKQSVPFDVIIVDLQKRIDEENPPLDENEIELQDRQGHRMTWKQYHRLTDIHGFMDYLAKTYPRIVSVNTIGKSFLGRDLKVLRISDGKPTNKAVFIDGGIHAREWISPATVTFFINQFAENFDEESDDVKNIDWYFLPVVNPDGYEYTHQVDRLWRKNRRPAGTRQCLGTDLNRNFGHHWGGKGSSGNPCSDIYRGSKAFSEPESKAVSDFILNSAAEFKAYLTYHSYGQYLLYPWGYDDAVPPDYKDLDIVGKEIAQEIQRVGGSKYTVGSSSGVLYPASGGSDDWAKAQGIKYSYTIELSDTGRYGFILPTSFIEPVAKESLAGLRVLARKLNEA
ncbi:carboxypeptidase B-like [Aricia agestis]|uniref:carboxypeptidase B-like n=1 Tax=Aricia agestis TaxID=91739 RepID=UPI001C20A864|nr:carboxypeptidase B-like [Aricia agestis]